MHAIHSQEEEAVLDLRLDGGTLVIPGTGLVQSSIGIKDGQILAIGAQDALSEATAIVDCTGKYVCPGVIDPHIHLGLYSDFARECVTETSSALAGGITTVGVFLRNPNSYFDLLPGAIAAIEQNSLVDAFLSVTLETPQHLDQMRDYALELGVTSFKVYMSGIPGLIPHVDDAFIAAALRGVAAMGYPAIACIHAENAALVAAAVEEARRDGDPFDLCTWDRAHPAMAEDEAVRRAAYLAEQTGGRVYLVHMSSGEAVRSLADIRAHSKRVLVEVNSSHLSLTTSCAAGLLAKMVPPLRGDQDVEALWQAVRDDVVDTFGTDNVSTTRALKRPEKGLFQSGGGKPALGTHFPVLLHEGYHRRRVPLVQIAEKASLRPAQIFGLYPRKGTIAVGSDADLVVVDLDKAVKVDHRELHSMSDFSLWDGMELRGWPVMTVKGGEIAVQDNVVKIGPGKGRYLRRKLG